MISDIDYNNFKNDLFLDLTYPLLHETSLEHANSILQNGISLKKNIMHKLIGLYLSQKLKMILKIIIIMLPSPIQLLLLSVFLKNC